MVEGDGTPAPRPLASPGDLVHGEPSSLSCIVSAQVLASLCLRPGLPPPSSQGFPVGPGSGSVPVNWLSRLGDWQLASARGEAECGSGRQAEGSQAGQVCPVVDRRQQQADRPVTLTPVTQGKSLPSLMT